MAQPNLPNIAGALQILANELPNVQNLPVVATTEQLHNITTQLQNLTTQIQNLTTQQQNLTTQQQNLTTQIQNLTTQQQTLQQNFTTQQQNLTTQQQALTTQLQTLTQSIEQLEQRTQARVANSTIRDNTTAIEPLYTNAGVVPPNFPPNFNAIRQITQPRSAEITALLTAYGQPAIGTLTVKKQRLAKFLGIKGLY